MDDNHHQNLVFWIDSMPFDKTNTIDLTYLTNDDTGMLMTGNLPVFWELIGSKVIGPELYTDNHVYKVINIDYSQNLIWLDRL